MVCFIFYKFIYFNCVDFFFHAHFLQEASIIYMNNETGSSKEKEDYKTTSNKEQQEMEFTSMYGDNANLSPEEKKKRKRNNIIKMIIIYSVIAVSFVFLVKMFVNLDVRVVTSNNAPLREKPSLTSKTLKNLKLYDEIVILKSENNWFQVETEEDKTEGYMLKAHVSKQSVNTQIEKNIVRHPLKTILFIAFMIMFYPVGLFIVSVSWKFSMEELSGKKVNTIDTFTVFAKANIAKYIPGGILHFFGRNYLGKNLGLTQTELGLSSAIEAVFFPFVCFILFLIFVFTGLIKIPFEKIYSRINFNNIVIMVIVAIAVIAVIIGVVVILFKKNIIKKDIFNQLKEISKRISTKRIILLCLKLFLLYTLFHITEAMVLVSTFLFIFNLNLSVYDVFLIMGSYITGYFFGMFIVAAPNSILVRETIIALVLSSYGYFGNVIVAGLIARSITIPGDIMAFLLSNFISFIKKKYKKPIKSY